jgi:hypothetical protein
MSRCGQLSEYLKRQYLKRQSLKQLGRRAARRPGLDPTLSP